MLTFCLLSDRSKKYESANTELTTKVENCEVEINDLVKINEVEHCLLNCSRWHWNFFLSKIIRDEFVSLQIKFEQLQTDYTRVQPKLLDLQRQLDGEKQLKEQLEEKLIESKKIQLDMLDAEVRRYDE